MKFTRKKSLLFLGLFLLLASVSFSFYEFVWFPLHMKKLVENLRDLNGREDPQAFKELRHYGRRAFSYYIAVLPRSEYDKRLSISHLMSFFVNDNLELFRQTLKRAKHWKVRETLVRAIALSPEHRVEKFNILKRAFSDPHQNVRYEAVKGFERYPKLARELYENMKDLLQHGQSGAEDTHSHGGHADVKASFFKHHRPQKAKAESTQKALKSLMKPHLCLINEDFDKDVRMALVKALPKILDDRDLLASTLLMSLKDRDRIVRETAKVELIKMGPQALSSLIWTLQNDKAIRYTIAEILASLGQPAIKPLMKLFAQPESILWYAVIDALERMGKKVALALPALCQHLNSSSRYHSREAAHLLAQIGKKAFPCLKRSLQKGKDLARKNAAYAFGLLGKKASSVGLFLATQFVREKVSAVREELLWALQQIPFSPVPHKMLTLLKADFLRRKPCRSPSMECLVFVRTLGQLGAHDREVYRLLLPLTMSQKTPLRIAALRALASIHFLTSTLIQNCFEGFLSPRRKVRDAAIELFVHHPAIIRRLQALLDFSFSCPSTEACESFILACSHSGSKAQSLFPFLNKIDQHANPYLRRLILNALPHLFSKTLPSLGIALLKRALADSSWKLKALAAKAISDIQELDEPSLFPLLAKNLTHKEWRVRRNTVRAIASMKNVPSSIVAFLRALRKDPSFGVRLSVRTALIKIQKKQNS